MKLFRLVREIDYSGISGTGIVAEGVEFDTGVVVMQWCVAERPSSIAVFGDMADVRELHGHRGATRIEYL